MKAKKSNFLFDSDKYLISEQPGLKILTTGVAVALVCGFFLRAMMNPSRIRIMVQEAGSHIDKDVKVSIDSAELSLADGIFPRFSVVVNNVRLESFNECWMSPELIADQIEIPFSIFSWLAGSNPIQHVYAKKVDLRFFGEPKDCGKKIGTSKSKAPAPDAQASKKGDPSKKENDAFELSQKESFLESIEIESLVIEHKKYPQFQPIELTRFEVTNLDPQKKHYQLNAKLHFIRDQMVGDYLSNSTLSIDYSEVPEPRIESHIFGNWREGRYSLQPRFFPLQNEFDLEGEIKDIPLSQVISLLKRWGLTTQDFNTNQVWVKARLKSSGNLTKPSEIPLYIESVNVYGDLGDLQIDKMEFSRINPLKLEPFVLYMREIDFDAIYNISNPNKKPNFLGKLGSFTGQADFESERKVKVSGIYSGLEFIFSNKGQRKAQQIKEASADLVLNDNRWGLHFSNFKLDEGTFNGFINMETDREFNKIELMAHGDSLELPEPIQSLMTNHGMISPVEFDLHFIHEDDKIKDFKGKFFASKLELEDIHFEGIKANMDSTKDTFLFSSEIKNLVIHQQSEAFNLFKEVMEPSWLKEGDLEAEQISGQFRFSDNNNFAWRGFSGLLPIAKLKFSTEGAWNSTGELQGNLITKGNKNKSEWVLTGTRDLPILRKK